MFYLLVFVRQLFVAILGCISGKTFGSTAVVKLVLDIVVLFEFNLSAVGIYIP